MNPAVIYTLDRALVRFLARHDDVPLLPVLVPVGTDGPRVRPLTMLLLLLPGQGRARHLQSLDHPGPVPAQRRPAVRLGGRNRQ